MRQLLHLTFAVAAFSLTVHPAGAQTILAGPEVTAVSNGTIQVEVKLDKSHPVRLLHWRTDETAATTVPSVADTIHIIRFPSPLYADSGMQYRILVVNPSGSELARSPSMTLRPVAAGKAVLTHANIVTHEVVKNDSLSVVMDVVNVPSMRVRWNRPGIGEQIRTVALVNGKHDYRIDLDHPVGVGPQSVEVSIEPQGLPIKKLNVPTTPPSTLATLPTLVLQGSGQLTRTRTSFKLERIPLGGTATNAYYRAALIDPQAFRTEWSGTCSVTNCFVERSGLHPGTPYTIELRFATSALGPWDGLVYFDAATSNKFVTNALPKRVGGPVVKLTRDGVTLSLKTDSAANSQLSAPVPPTVNPTGKFVDTRNSVTEHIYTLKSPLAFTQTGTNVTAELTLEIRDVVTNQLLETVPVTIGSEFNQIPSFATDKEHWSKHRLKQAWDFFGPVAKTLLGF